MNIKKILIIFLFAFLLTFLIYKKYNTKDTNILVLGDNSLLEKYNYIDYLKDYFDNVNYYFMENNKTLKGISEDIQNNKNIYKKEEFVFLNQKISDSNIIIINSNYSKYLVACKKNKRILDEYIEKEYKSFLKLKEKISHITDAKIIIIGNYCNCNKVKELYKEYNYIDINELEKLNNKEIDILIYNELNMLIRQK